MVEFGKKLKERQIQEWQRYYINYKLMKKKVKQYANQIQARALDHRHVLKDFSRMLDTQIEKIVLFMLEQQGLLASRISQLNEQQESLQEQPDISKICDLREAYRAVGRDLLKLLFFVEMNAMGLRKILKKFDKRLGLGSARAVNRRYISDCVPLKYRMQASAGFVSASALGMACGPAIAGLLQTEFKIYKVTMNQETLPGWLMALLWLLYLVLLWITFREPVRETEVNHAPQQPTTEEQANLEKGLVQPLLLKSTENEEDEEGDDECDMSEEASEESRLPAKSLGSAYRLLTPSVKVQLLIYFMLKYAMEILLSESSVVTTYYFGWTTGTVSIFLTSLGLTVLPVNIVVGSYISNMYEDRQLLLASEIMVFLGILFSFHFIIPYSATQYIISGLVMFVSAEVLEGVNLSLLSRVMSSRLSRGTYNGGLLSTEAGTLARVQIAI